MNLPPDHAENGEATHPLPLPPVAAIGASAGGIEALQSLFRSLPVDTGIAYVVVLHLAPDVQSSLDVVLTGCTRMPVKRVDGELLLEADRVYVIAPGHRLDVHRQHIVSSPFDEPGEQRLSIDGFFNSLATHHGDGFAVVLSGTGRDGAAGIGTIKEAGGVVLVQDPIEAAFDTMPRAAIATGMVDFVLPVQALAARLVELASSKQRVRAQLSGDGEALLSSDDESALFSILGLLRARTGHDFTHYKRATVLRRVLRRVQVLQCETFARYQECLRERPSEAQALFDDLLITVTGFFRDPDAWQALADEVLPRLFDARPIDEPVRAWAAGCATGEEAYSLVMLLIEEAERRERWPELQVFATDLDDAALVRARDGRYPASIAEHVRADRLERFFVRDNDGYRVAHALRERVLFTSHSLLKDPPFTRLDLVVCRNLLIYLERPVQRQIFDIFRYALHPNGYLFLGSAETVDGEPFTVVDGTHRLYRSELSERAPALPEMILGGPRLPEAVVIPTLPVTGLPSALSVNVELRALVPPSVLIDLRRRVVQSLAGASRYLHLPDGAPSTDLLALVLPELQLGLRLALDKAFERNEPVLVDPLSVLIEDRHRDVWIWVSPRGDDPGNRRALVAFLETDREKPDDAPSKSGDVGSRLLERDLRERLQVSESLLVASSDDHVAALEAVRAANEELQSVNEEYRSTAEELETSKEELQSINEELNSVNTELKLKLAEVSRGHDDLENLMSATDIGTLFLDRELRIQRFTPTLTQLFSIQNSDRGRMIGDLTHRLDYTTLQDDARGVLQALMPLEREARHRDGRRFAVRLRPYKTGEHRIDGVVLTFIDISEHRAKDDALRASEARLNTLLESIPDVPFTTDPDGRLTWISARAATPDSTTHAALLDRPIWDVLMHPDDRQHGEANWIDAGAAGKPFEMRHRAPAGDGGWHWVITRAQPSLDPGSDTSSDWVGTITDVDELTNAEVALRDADRHRNRFLGLLGHELRNPLAAISNGLQLLGDRNDSAGDAAWPHQETLAALQRQSAHMSRLVDDLLDLTRISNGKVELRVERIDLIGSIEQSLRVMRPRVLAAGMQLAMNVPHRTLWVEADKDRLVQVVDNLVDNAIKYSDAGAIITLGVEPHADRVEVRISDTGIGIAADVLPTLFDPFTQGSGAGEQDRGGLGLGLALVRTLVQLHGGDVRVHSDGPGRGSAFSVLLPLGGQRSSTRTVDPASTAPHVSQNAPDGVQFVRLRVLVVDDSSDVANPFAALLRTLGHTVEVAYDGPSGLKVAATQRPEVAFLDLGMPGMDGLELARRLRREFAQENLVLIAVTGYGQQQDIDAAREAGFDRHLLKPVRMAAVRALFEEFA